MEGEIENEEMEKTGIVTYGDYASGSRNNSAGRLKRCNKAV